MSYANEQDRAAEHVAMPGDFFALLKPRVMVLVVFTALAGLLSADGRIHPVIAVASLLAIAVGAGASGALNMWFDADVDAIMGRTRTRPIPSGRVTPEEALGFGLTLSVFSVFTLGLVANWLAASLLAFTIFFYVIVYTMWLKRWTPQNIVIGGAAGALPPVIGHAAVTGTIGTESLLLFALIFVWTPPHFWALALLKIDDYGRAGLPMMPNAKGADRTRLEILVYTVVMALVALGPWAFGYASAVYGAVAAASGLGMIGLAWQVWRHREGDAARRACGRLFGYSILYLFGLFGVIVAERVVALTFGGHG